MKKQKQKKNVIKNNLYMLRIAWKVSKKRVVAEFLMKALSMFKSYFISLVFIQVIVDYISDRDLQSLLYFLAVSVVFFLITDYLETWFANRFLPLSNCLFYKKMNDMLFTKASNLDLKCFEDSEFYDMYVLASREAESRIISVIANMSGVIFSFVTVVALYVSMFSIDRFVILIAVFPLISIFVILKKINETNYSIEVEKAPYSRAVGYTERVSRLRDYAEELRLYNVKNILLRILRENTGKIVDIISKFRVRQGVRSVFQLQLAFTFLYEGTILYSAYMVLVNRSMTLGEFVVLASAMKTGIWTLYGLTFQMAETVKNGLFVKNFINFMKYEPEIPEDQDGEPVPAEFEELEFRNVSFRYKENKPVLRNISMKIKKGEVIAIVGYNGVGKTTFTKLLTRLYDPYEGEILFNGRPVKEYNLKQYRDKFSVLSQDFKIFALSIRDNVLAGRSGSDEQIYDAIDAAGLSAKVRGMENGLDQILTKEFEKNGAVLSGGESQKIAIARSFMKGFQIAVFDEPSSALDPVSEYNLFKEMLEICKDKTLIFISHRLSSTVFADRIFVFNDGVIEEAGTHNELYAKKGIYYKMFSSQAERYIDEEEIYNEK